MGDGCDWRSELGVRRHHREISAVNRKPGLGMRGSRAMLQPQVWRWALVLLSMGVSALTDAGREHAFIGYSEKGTPKQVETIAGQCTDDSSFCGDWAQQGECTKCARWPILPPAPANHRPVDSPPLTITRLPHHRVTSLATDHGCSPPLGSLGWHLGFQERRVHGRQLPAELQQMRGARDAAAGSGGRAHAGAHHPARRHPHQVLPDTPKPQLATDVSALAWSASSCHTACCPPHTPSLPRVHLSPVH